MSDTFLPRDRRAAILQSCCIPWNGFFDVIATVDVFVVYDDVQYSKNDWHNRNLIKARHGMKWLTVPVFRMHGEDNTIDTDTTRVPGPFAEKHWRSIAQSYAKARFFKKYSEKLEQCFTIAEKLENLSAVSGLLLEFVCRELGTFQHSVTILDLILNTGPDARTFLKPASSRKTNLEELSAMPGALRAVLAVASQKANE